VGAPGKSSETSAAGSLHMKDLLTFRGRSQDRNVVLARVQDREGVVVDTHVSRIARRLEFTKETTRKNRAGPDAHYSRERWILFATSSSGTDVSCASPASQCAIAA